MDWNYEVVIERLLVLHSIKVVKWSKGSNGRAWILKREIKIPRPTTLDRFCIGLHEIGHVVKQASRLTMKLYQSEFLAESFVFDTCAKLGIDCSSYKERARRYIIMCIAKGHARKLNLDLIPAHIRDFCGIDFNLWKGKKIFVTNWGTDSYTKPLTILDVSK